MTCTDLTSQIIGAAIKVHRKLGPGLLESAYEACLAYELEQLGLHVQRQKAVPLIYGIVKLECGFRADLVVDGKVVLRSSVKKHSTRWTKRNYCLTCDCWISRLAS
jgi:GxxExxY protein